MSCALKILAIETASEQCSAAVWYDGTLYQQSQLAPREHARLILPMMQAVLDEAGLSLSQLDAIAFGRGPGAFTGVRIAASVAQGSAFAADLPVLAISSLAALAQQGLDQGSRAVFAATDARMQEVYCASFGADAQGLAQPLTEEQVCSPQAVSLPVEPERFSGIGSGFASYPDALRQALGPRLTQYQPNAFAEAACVARLAVRAYHSGQQLPPEQAMPVYLRDHVADPPKRPPLGYR
ncbi:tRNA (adenosine(37)-N6)-threonylcarbamoyltransferase complex dimerization subunit type 1 TsaB [Thiorhodospira sibirica]|uniref:tRNA (adenosine(37)-N6)-threonylcarbamoyltransferase complex dimerization subunit type 1 TsaB n=1 Tax=Thiorhodospira sibirica TaxID=154347 RepID=UPI00022C11C1|nr:tRNA (adenosine(37)-N6)-threonylcarbamoyltransferase complex dimerization subunit type 1 TsaB [Thiorhodospira sibirica]